MSTLTLQVTLDGMQEVDAILHGLRNALARRGPMHARMAVRAQKETQRHVKGLNRHRSAQRLSATPTGRDEKSAARVTADSDDDEARVVIPRNTGLGRAFGDVVIRPGSGRTYLTLAGHPQTYGKSVRDFPEDAFQFAILIAHRPFPVLLWADGPYKGDVAYWLRREATQKQDRDLLPSDETYIKAGRLGAAQYLTSIMDGGNAGPSGGTSTGMPSA